MKLEAAVKYFGTQEKVAEALGITQGAVSQWGDYVPELRARQLVEITRGALAFVPSHYRRGKR